MSSNVQLSPDGQWVAFVKNETGNGDLCVAPASEKGFEKALPAASQPIGAWGWTQRNELIFTQKTTEVWALKVFNPATGQVADITPFPFQAARQLATSPELPNLAAWSFQSDRAENDGVFLLDLSTNSTQKMTDRAGFSNFYFDKQLRLCAGIQPNEEGAHTLYRRTSAGEWVLVADYSWSVARISTMPEGVVSVDAPGRVCWFVDAEGLDKLALKQVDLVTGKIELVLQSANANILWSGAAIHPRTGVPQAVASWFGETQRFYTDISLKSDFDFLKAKLGGDVGLVTRSANDDYWLVRNMDGRPFTYWRYERANKALIRLFSDFPQGDKLSWATRRAFVVKARDGLLLPCSLYLPAGADQNGDGKPEKPLPTLLYVHGGPWVGGLQNIWLANRHFQFLASRGYAVIVTEFRSAIGYGKKFLDAGNREWGGAMHTDMLDIARAARKAGVAAKDKIGIWGWSYGGYAAAAALAYSPETFACGIAMYGVFDLETMCKLPGANDPLWHTRVGDNRTKEGQELLKQHSPQNYVGKMTKPLLLTHGELDKMVPKAQSDAMSIALDRANKPYTYFYYPEEGHDYMKPATWESFWAVGEEFFQRHLGGLAEPPGDAVAQGGMVLLKNGLQLKSLEN